LEVALWSVIGDACPMGRSIVQRMTVWAQEFDGPAGSTPDPSVWMAELGGGGWGDDQLQSYTRSPANAYLTGSGQLAIVARDDPDAPGGVSSARLTTRGLVSFKYGHIAARIKVPSGAGVWPAFWMLGTDIDAVGWPACGEIDVMEHVGGDPTAVHGTVHGTGYAGVGHGVGRRFDSGSPLSDDFHTYSVAWMPGSVTWRLDGKVYLRLTAVDVPGPWPFEQPFFLVINLAIGGSWPGNGPEATLPAEMLIDWIRVVDSEVRESPTMI
jgi:beta-glucanase (GH16 family)